MLIAYTLSSDMSIASAKNPYLKAYFSKFQASN
jgi:hypothetical protein